MPLYRQLLEARVHNKGHCKADHQPNRKGFYEGVAPEQKPLGMETILSKSNGSSNNSFHHGGDADGN